MSARDELFQDLTQWYTTEESLELMNAYRDEVVSELEEEISGLHAELLGVKASVRFLLEEKRVLSERLGEANDTIERARIAANDLACPYGCEYAILHILEGDTR